MKKYFMLIFLLFIGCSFIPHNAEEQKEFCCDIIGLLHKNNIIDIKFTSAIVNIEKSKIYFYNLNKELIKFI